MLENSSCVQCQIGAQNIWEIKKEQKKGARKKQKCTDQMKCSRLANLNFAKMKRCRRENDSNYSQARWKNGKKNYRFVIDVKFTIYAINICYDFLSGWILALFKSHLFMMTVSINLVFFSYTFCGWSHSNWRNTIKSIVDFVKI